MIIPVGKYYNNSITINSIYLYRKNVYVCSNIIYNILSTHPFNIGNASIKGIISFDEYEIMNVPWVAKQSRQLTVLGSLSLISKIKLVMD